MPHISPFFGQMWDSTNDRARVLVTFEISPTEDEIWGTLVRRKETSYSFSQIIVAGGSPGAPPTSVIVFPSPDAVNAHEETVLPFKFCTIRMLYGPVRVSAIRKPVGTSGPSHAASFPSSVARQLAFEAGILTVKADRPDTSITRSLGELSLTELLFQDPMRPMGDSPEPSVRT